jgi:hypothetical protein
VNLYFAGAGQVMSQLPVLVARYGAGAAVPVADTNGVLAAAYHPAGLTVLLVFGNATAEVLRGLPVDFQLTPALRQLRLASTSLSTRAPTAP